MIELFDQQYIESGIWNLEPLQLYCLRLKSTWIEELSSEI